MIGKEIFSSNMLDSEDEKKNKMSFRFVEDFIYIFISFQLIFPNIFVLYFPWN